MKLTHYNISWHHSVLHVLSSLSNESPEYKYNCWDFIWHEPMIWHDTMIWHATIIWHEPMIWHDTMIWHEAGVDPSAATSMRGQCKRLNYKMTQGSPGSIVSLKRGH